MYLVCFFHDAGDNSICPSVVRRRRQTGIRDRVLAVAQAVRANVVVTRREGGRFAVVGYHLGCPGAVAVLVMHGLRRGHYERLCTLREHEQRTADTEAEASRLVEEERRRGEERQRKRMHEEELNAQKRARWEDEERLRRRRQEEEEEEESKQRPGMDDLLGDSTYDSTPDGMQHAQGRTQRSGMDDLLGDSTYDSTPDGMQHAGIFSHRGTMEPKAQRLPKSKSM